MASFEKHGGQSKRGWNAKKGVPLQVMALGSDAEVSLWGSGSHGEVFEVAVHDSTVCTIHERVTGKAEPNWRKFVITSLKKGKTWIQARMPAPDRSVVAYL